MVDDIFKPYVPDLIYYEDSQCLEYMSEDVAATYETVHLIPELNIIKNFEGDITGFKLSGKREHWEAFAHYERLMSDQSRELDRRDETINSYKKLLADERAEVQRLKQAYINCLGEVTRLKQELATARKDALEEAAAPCDKLAREADRDDDDCMPRAHGLVPMLFAPSKPRSR
jgi:hypothetical protein